MSTPLISSTDASREARTVLNSEQGGAPRPQVQAKCLSGTQLTPGTVI